jgi:hypothetical protein
MTVREADLLSIYALYPRKVDKSDGMKVLRLTVKTLDDLELCRRAVTNFAQAMKGQEARFIRHFGRWAKSWRDWIGKGTERLSPIPKPSGPVVERDEVRAMAEMLVGRLRGVK